MGDEKQINQELANPISKLDDAAAFSPNDKLALFSTQTGAHSYALPYLALARQLVSDISARFGLSSMAFRDKSEYARFDHQHGYSNVACYPLFSPENTDHPIRVMSLDITNMYGTKSVDVYMPSLEVPPEPEPEIGDVRFLATDSLTARYGEATVEYVRVMPDGSTQVEYRTEYNVNLEIVDDIKNGTFDGWVFPDGSRYYKAQGSYDFSRAYTAFGGSNGEFRVPNLNGFVKANPGTYRNGDALKRMPGQTGINQHSHNLAYSESDVGNITVEATVKLSTASNFSSKEDYGTLHVGSGTEDSKGLRELTADSVSLPLNFSAGDNRKFTYDSDPADESYPDHYVMPVQIYIGKSYIGNPAREITYGVQVTNIYGVTTNYENITRLTRQSIGVRGETDSTIRKIVVGNDVTEIDPGVFANFTQLTRVDMHSCSEYVDVPESCCDGCIRLQSFIFPMS